MRINLNQSANAFCILLLADILLTFGIAGYILWSIPSGNEPEMFTFLGKLNRAALFGAQVAIAISACVAIYKSPLFALTAFLGYLAFVFYGEYYWATPEYTPEFAEYAAKIAEEARGQKSDITLEVRTYPFWFNKVLYLAAALCLMFVLWGKQYVTPNK